MKKIYKYPTGAEIPEGAIYLSTVSQTEVETNNNRSMTSDNSVDKKYSVWGKCWLVWHYFLVEVEDL